MVVIIIRNYCIPQRGRWYTKEILQFQGLNVVQIMIAIGKLLFHIKWHTQTKTFT